MSTSSSVAQLTAANEALLLEGASPAQIDRVFTDFGWPMGPFQMYDVIGLNTPYNILSQGDARARALAAWLKENYIDKGRLGVASGEGFYSYKSTD